MASPRRFVQAVNNCWYSIRFLAIALWIGAMGVGPGADPACAQRHTARDSSGRSTGVEARSGTTRSPQPGSTGTPVDTADVPGETEPCPIRCASDAAPPTYDAAPPRPTLTAWAHDRRLMVLDRQHAVGSRTFDRGVFRHVTSGMDREYDLDMMAYRFSPFEDARWQKAGDGVRMRTGSIERDTFAIKTTIRNTIPLDDSGLHYFTIEGVLQEDVQAKRAWLEMSYARRLGERHAVGVRHTFASNKADLDLTPFYSYASPVWGRANVALTLQNVYNDFIYERLGIDEEVLDLVRTYDRNPYLLELHYSSPRRFSLGGEITVGWQPESRAHFELQTAPSFQYREDERLHYLSALLEYRYDPVSVGLFVKRDASELRRVSTGDSLATDYRARQTQQRIGAFAKGDWRNWHAEIYAFTGGYRDKQDGENFETSVLERAINFDTEQSGLHSRLFYEPDGWPYLGIEYMAFRRDLGPNPRTLVNGWTYQYWDFGPSNYRAVGLIGYRFSRGSAAMGIGYDLDGDPLMFTDRTRRFDNGFFRLTLVW